LINLLTDFYRRRRFIFDTSAAEDNTLAGGLLILDKSAAENNTLAGGRSKFILPLLKVILWLAVDCYF
jgi:hypothetical protein